MTVQQLKDRIAANSAAWHETTDEKTRAALHEENVKLYGQLDAQTGSQSGFDSTTGRWSTNEPGTGSYQATGAPEARDLSGMVTAAQKAATEKAVAALEKARSSAQATLDAEAAALPGQYTAAKNYTAAQNEIERHNTANLASDRGLSSGAAGQVALAQSVAAQNDLGALELQLAAAKDDIKRRRSQMEMDYDYAVAEAQAEGDYALAQALYQEASRFDAAQRQQWLDTEAMAKDVYTLARENVQAQAKAEAEEYARLQDTLNWAFKLDARDYDREQDALSWAFKLDQRDYDREQDAKSWAFKLEERDYERARTEANDAWKRQRDLVDESLRRQSINNTSVATQLRLAQDLADHGDFSGYAGLGYSQHQITVMTALWQKYMDAKSK